MTEPTPVPVEPSSWRYRAVMTAAVVVAFAALFAGVRATTTESDQPVTVNGRPEVVEHLYPRNGAEVLRQVEVGIDLVSGYEGTLVLNGVPLPEGELRLVPEQNQMFFTPGPDKAVEKLSPGTNCAIAVVWESSEGRGVDDLTYRWCFDAT